MRTDRQIERILDLSRRLEGEKYWTRRELQDLYSVDPSTINRHINVLRSIHSQAKKYTFWIFPICVSNPTTTKTKWL